VSQQELSDFPSKVIEEIKYYVYRLIDHRIDFIGDEAVSAVKELYMWKRVPYRFRNRGATNPVKYSF
jgi:hypothetical protein